MGSEPRSFISAGGPRPTAKAGDGRRCRQTDQVASTRVPLAMLRGADHVHVCWMEMLLLGGLEVEW